MTDTPQPFRVVLRGYEPAQVDQRIQQLAAQAEEARAYAEQLAERVRLLEQEPSAGGEPAAAPPATFEHLGERVAKILSLAEAEARDLLERGRTLLDDERSQVADEVSRQRSEADRHAEQTRSDADTEAARVLEDARRSADDRLDAAERDAAARLQEAEAIYEQQRAKAAQAAADFETTLARRRSAAEEDFTTQMQDARQRLAELEAHIDDTRTAAEKMNDETVRENRRLVEEAEKQAASIVGEARAQAARIRADSDRELAAATQRRDSINAQLANVRQMLATLTGGASVSMMDVALGEQEGASEDAVEAPQGAVELEGEEPVPDEPESGAVEASGDSSGDDEGEDEERS
jgi:cell division septum initiation protein DivIVA